MASTNNNQLNASIPVFTGSDFHLWEQKMLDYLQSQRLWRMANNQVLHPVEAVANAPMAAEAALQATWDENSEQIQGIIGSQILTTLHPHLGMTCAQTWTK